MAWNIPSVNTYASSDISVYLNADYKKKFDSDVRAAMGTTRFYYTPGNGDTTLTTLQRSIFLLSTTELGRDYEDGNPNVEGTPLPIAETLQFTPQPSYEGGQWTHVPQGRKGPLLPGISTTIANMASSGRQSTMAFVPASKGTARHLLSHPLSVSDDGSVSLNTTPPLQAAPPAAPI